MNAWKPIETAPKDGSEILLRMPGPEPTIPGFVRVGRWDREASEWTGKSLSEPTYWQPLPSPDLDSDGAPTLYRRLQETNDSLTRQIAKLHEQVDGLTQEKAKVDRARETEAKNAGLYRWEAVEASRLLAEVLAVKEQLPEGLVNRISKELATSVSYASELAQKS